MSRETSQRLISPGSGVRSQSCSERTFRDCYPTGLGLQRSTCRVRIRHLLQQGQYTLSCDLCLYTDLTRLCDS